MNSKNKLPSFWTPTISNNYKTAKTRLVKSPTHPMLLELYQYDAISHETLQQFRVGIMEMWGKDWVCFPYKTGIQLYRRENGEKIINTIPGSKPRKSFFGLPNSLQKEMLIIAKSPRETMLLHQLIGDKANIIGLASGETGTLTEDQGQHLREALKGVDSIYILLDTDNPNSKSISMSLASNISKNYPQKVFHADVSKHSNENYKDITDAVRGGKDAEYVMKLLNSAEKINNIKNITPLSNGYEIKPEQFPDSVYKVLPGKLRDAFEFVDRSKNRDVLFMASLPVIAAHLDNVFSQYGGKEISPDLYSMIIAPAAAGKGFANQARQLGLHLSDSVNEENQRRLDLINLQAKNETKNVPQKLKSLFIPANSSSRAIYDLLQANDGKGLIFETEIDTMLAAIAQDWGNFSDLTRKAFHHENCSLSRKGELLTVNNPRLSMFMSGTHDQFKEMFRNSGNGLYSRFAFYTFEAEPEWISQRPTENINQLHIYIDGLSRWLHELNRKLNDCEGSLEVKLADYCWDQKDTYFEHKIEEFKQEGYPEDVLGNITRSGIILMKICMIFTILRAYHEFGDDLFSRDSITVEDTDFKNALTIVDTLMNHSFYLYGLLTSGNGGVLKNQRMEQFYNDLPVAFDKKTALEIGVKLDLSTASVGRYLKTFTSNGILNSIKHGEYAKVNQN